MAVPEAPSAPVASDVTQRTLIVQFDPNADGGSPIYNYELGYSAVSDLGTATIVAGYPPTSLSGLSPATTYFFWARAENSFGWSPWSTQGFAKTIAGARVCVSNVWKDAVPYVRVGGVWKIAGTWVKAAGVWREGS